MNIYKIKRTDDILDDDQYDSAVVVADNEEEARTTHPAGHRIKRGSYSFGWVKDLDSLDVQLIGTAAEGIPNGAVCASYNAG